MDFGKLLSHAFQTLTTGRMPMSIGELQSRDHVLDGQIRRDCRHQQVRQGVKVETVCQLKHLDGHAKTGNERLGYHVAILQKGKTEANPRVEVATHKSK
jgi:hypothetical protein